LVVVVLLLLLLLLLLTLWTYESSNTSGEKSVYFLVSPATAERSSDGTGVNGVRKVYLASVGAPVKANSQDSGS
jgi:hypothetical protein